jgi:hypothetical protein
MYSIHSIKATVSLSVAALAFSGLTPKLNAHGFEGDYFFPPTIQTDDPFATDELTLPVVQIFRNPASPGVPRTLETDFSSEFDKEIFPKFAVGIIFNYIILDPHNQPATAGFDNLGFDWKYQLFENPEHQFIFSVGGEVDIGGTGSKAIGRESFSTYTPTIYFGKAFGDLPDSLKYWKPFAITGTLGYVIPGEAVDPNALNWGLAVEYSIPYLQQHVQEIDWLRPVRNAFPLVEFVGNSPLNHGGGYSTLTINPGFLWETHYFQVGAEAVIPANRATGVNVGAVLQFQVYIDDIWPKVFGYPVFFRDSK